MADVSPDGITTAHPQGLSMTVRYRTQSFPFLVAAISLLAMPAVADEVSNPLLATNGIPANSKSPESTIDAKSSDRGGDPDNMPDS
ncbi:MAG: hypothetical protein JJ992_00450, partial [Planctomycetes bacterium]|nr:hypothetical protein [Planctomycetota bacterium]